MSRRRDKATFFDLTDDKNRRKTADKILARPKSSNLVAEMDQMIKENILYPEVQDTEEDILEDKDLKDFENLHFLKEDTHSILKPASPCEFLSNCSNGKPSDLIGS
jgi:hypothetical protein